MKIEKEISFVYGHRVPWHKSKCKNIHGHAGVIMVTLKGEIKDIRGESDDGMIIDFSDIKALLMSEIQDKWDHGFIVYDKDIIIRDFLRTLPEHKTIEVPFIPTAENLAKYAFNLLYREYKRIYGVDLELVSLTFWETSTSKAIATVKDLVGGDLWDKGRIS